MGVSWVYRLRKEQLIQELHAHGIGTEGTVVQMRQRLVAYVRRNPEIFADKLEDDPDYKEEADVTKDLLDFHEELAAGLFNSSTSTPLRNHQTVRNVPEVSTASTAVNTVIDQMRKWNCHFDGRDPRGFLERVNELQQAYHLSDRHMLEDFPELLRGDAQLWYRCATPSVTSWANLQEQLREYYLPPGERRHLDRQIADRRQGPNEKILPYVTAMTTLIRRRGGYSLDQELDTLYYNMRGEFQLRIRRDEVKTVTQLIQRVGEIEEILTTMKKETSSWRTEGTRSYVKQEATNKTFTAVTTPYSRTTHCWKCKQPGHDRLECKNRQLKFCSFCGSDGVLTRDCECHRGFQGNGRAKITYNPAIDPPENRIFLGVTINNHQTEALLDSGSVCSYVNNAMARKCVAAGWQVAKESTLAAMADGTEAELKWSIRGTGIINGIPLEHQYFVMGSMEHEVLLGMDALSKLGLAIRIGDQEIYPAIKPNRTSTCTVTVQKGLSYLTVDESQQLQELIQEEQKKFEKIHGATSLTEHEIRLEDPTPIKQRYRPRNPAMQAIIDAEVEKMLKDGVVQPSRSPWSSPIVLARKKDGKHRFCVDFRRLNKVTKKDAYPLPQINAMLDKLRGARYLSTIDLKNGYWQVPLTPASRPLTAFTVPGKGLLEFRVMPFGLHSAPSTFQRLLDQVISPDMAPHAFSYLDDIVIASKTFQEHVRVLRQVFQRLRAANLRPNWEKCHFAHERLKYLGHVVDQEGLHTDPEKVAAVTLLAPPTGVKELRRFLGLLSWYRRFLPDVSRVAAPLTELLTKKAKWRWEAPQQKAFDQLRQQLTEAPILAVPNWERPFTLQTDASQEGLAAVLTQESDNGERVIAYASRTLNHAERNYSTTELECLAVRWGIWKMRHYLEGYHFIVLTDHQSLKWLEKIDNPSGRLARWAMELSQWDFEIRYRRGPENTVTDALSRQPVQVCGTRKKEKCTWYYRQLKAVRERPMDHPEYQIRGGRLYRHILHTLDFDEHPVTEEWKLCVATNDRVRVLHECHNEPTAGHLGIAKTLARPCRLYYWPGMLREGARHVRTCDSCQKYKAAEQNPAGLMHATPVDRPWEMVSADLVGPLPRSSTGNTTLLVIQDRFTKWIELKPLRRATGPAITRAIRELVVLRHGCPNVLVTDNGRQFVGKELGKALNEWGVKHRRTPPYTPQCNPVERVNKVVKTMLSQYIGRSQRTWDEHYAEVAFAYNTAQHSAMGYPPAYLNTGRELVPPGSLRYKSGPRRAAGLNEQLRRGHKEARELAKCQIARSFQNQRKYYDKNRRNWEPDIGSLVLKRTHILSDKAAYRNAKLSQKYNGPFRVQRRVSPVIFDLLDNSRYLKPHELAPTPRGGATSEASVLADERGCRRSARLAARQVSTATAVMANGQPVSTEELDEFLQQLEEDYRRHGTYDPEPSGPRRPTQPRLTIPPARPPLYQRSGAPQARPPRIGLGCVAIRRDNRQPPAYKPPFRVPVVSPHREPPPQAPRAPKMSKRESQLAAKMVAETNAARAKRLQKKFRLWNGEGAPVTARPAKSRKRVKPLAEPLSTIAEEELVQPSPPPEVLLQHLSIGETSPIPLPKCLSHRPRRKETLPDGYRVLVPRRRSAL
ncbi:uncharacterized protein LOC143218903 [Lasioglossum baleicum]|uniref:uncharacterized protein LOC143218903 n=1 Tax=Lasioglossum baleicum TaxID=434251 RepID=UPI003FCD8AAA